MTVQQPPFPWVLFSDIHGNLCAAESVVADWKKRYPNATAICLGDTVGYGPRPVDCLNLVMSECDFSILGNHDQAVLFDPQGFNDSALEAIYWTREQFDRSRNSEDLYQYLGEMKSFRAFDEILLVHGSPRHPTNEYVSPEDIYQRRKMEGIFERLTRLGFAGHTHKPGIFAAEKLAFSFLEQSHFGEGPVTFDPAEKYFINVGSVGQPRDGDTRACYCVVTETGMTFHRVQYDVETTVKEILANKRLSPHSAERLRKGG